MIEIITIGDELVSGSTSDENSRYISEAIYSIGMTVSKITTIGDAVEDIENTLRGIQEQTCFVVITGGLGPTEDDRTAQAAAGAFGRKLILNQQALDEIEKKLKKFDRTVSTAGRKQAILPDGCIIVPNPVGTACGFLIEDGKRHFVFLPGVPEEVRAMTESFLLDRLKKIIKSKQVILNQTLRVFGLWESAIQDRLRDVFPDKSTASLGYYPDFPEIRLKITGRGSDPERVRQDMSKFQEIIYEKIGEYIYSDRDEPLEEVIGTLLKNKKATLSIAESCTGGLITHRLTNIAGSSQYIERSFIVYSNMAKQELLNVPSDMIQKFGAVSEPVAFSMAEGVRVLSGTTYGLAVTGIAGPAGGSAEKPVGTVFIGVSSLSGTEVKQYLFHGSRDIIKIITSHTALNNLRKFINAIYNRS
jgi:nicotinamide-nucleotide amidase